MEIVQEISQKGSMQQNNKRSFNQIIDQSPITKKNRYNEIFTKHNFQEDCLSEEEKELFDKKQEEFSLKESMEQKFNKEQQELIMILMNKFELMNKQTDQQVILLAEQLEESENAKTTNGKKINSKIDFLKSELESLSLKLLRQDARQEKQIKAEIDNNNHNIEIRFREMENQIKELRIINREQGKQIQLLQKKQNRGSFNGFFGFCQRRANG